MSTDEPRHFESWGDPEDAQSAFKVPLDPLNVANRSAPPRFTAAVKEYISVPHVSDTQIDSTLDPSYNAAYIY
jgi:hypothetical protein